MAKCILFFLLVFLATFSSISQISQRSNFIGGSAEMQYKYMAVGSEGGPNKVLSIPILVNYGRFITPRLALGMGVGYSYFKEERANKAKDTTYIYSLPTFTFVPQAKYFFPIWNEKFYFVAGLNLGYGIQKVRIDLQKSDGNEEYYKGNRFLMDLNIRPSLVYFIHKHFALEATCGYFGYTRVLRSDSKNELAGSKYDYSIRLSFAPSTLSIGLNYFFASRDKTKGKDEK